MRPDGGFVFTNLAKVPLHPLDLGSGPPIEIARHTIPTPPERSCAVFSRGDKLLLLMSCP